VRKRIEEIYNKVDDATHGAAEMVLIMTLGSAVATGLYCALAGIVWCLLTIIDIFF
jgi:hypothetical protein